MARTICLLQDISKEYRIRRGFFDTRGQKLRALDRVTLGVAENEILGLVGESGCGKSTLAKVALGLERPSSGQVFFEGNNVADLDRQRLKLFRRKAQMVFQDPYSSLNPKMTIFQIVSEPLRIHKLCPPREYRDQVARLLKDVGMEMKGIEDRYPHEFSGGQRQRIGLARALATRPKLIVADEPTSALDVSIQAQIINLLLDLQERHGLSYLFISHDLPIIQFVSHRVAVMYKGQLMELMPRKDFITDLDKGTGIHHPYTEFLLKSVPIPDPQRPIHTETGHRQDVSIRPLAPHFHGCAFAVRCRFSKKICLETRPRFKEVTRNHFMACHVRAGT